MNSVVYFSPDPDVAHDTLVSQVFVSVEEASLDEVPVLATLGDDLLLQRVVLRGAEHEDQPRDHPGHVRLAPGTSDDVTIILGDVKEVKMTYLYRLHLHISTLFPRALLTSII